MTAWKISAVLMAAGLVISGNAMARSTGSGFGGASVHTADERDALRTEQAERMLLNGADVAGTVDALHQMDETQIRRQIFEMPKEKALEVAVEESRRLRMDRDVENSGVLRELAARGDILPILWGRPDMSDAAVKLAYSKGVNMNRFDRADYERLLGLVGAEQGGTHPLVVAYARHLTPTDVDAAWFKVFNRAAPVMREGIAAPVMAAPPAAGGLMYNHARKN